MNKNQKIALALVAIALPLFAVSVSFSTAKTATSSTHLPPSIPIDFSIYPANDAIVVERGKATVVPLKVEALNNSTATMQIRLAFERGNADPELLRAALSKPTMVLSSLDVANGRAIDLGNGIGVWDVGTITLNAANTLPPGTYTFGLEAEQQVDGKLADKLVSGTIVTVTVR